MTVLARRDLLKATALTGVLAVPAGIAVTRGRAPVLVFDSRIAEARGFAAMLSGAPAMDLASADATRWKAIRAGMPRGRTVEGLTRWSDWIAVRGELEAQGLRLAHEAILRRSSSRRSDLVRWGMVPRTDAPA